MTMTAAERKQADARERSKALRASFDARVAAQDPDDALTHDHHFNPRHPDFDPDCTCGVTGERRVAVDVLNDTRGDTAEPLPQRSNGDRLRAASTKSVAYLEQLIEQARKRLNDPSIIEMALAAIADSSQREVSQAIDELKKQLKNAGASHRSNKYAQPCETCGQTVAAGEGVLLKSADGRWIVLHGSDPEDCPARSDESVSAAQPDTSDLSGRRQPESALDLSTLPSGRYAVPGGDTRLKIRVDNLKRDKSRNPRWDGFIFVKDAAEYGRGTRYGSQRPGQLYVGDVQDELRAILADPTAALAAYGQLTGHCGVCGRKLEDETSVALGIGPVCRSKI